MRLLQLQLQLVKLNGLYMCYSVTEFQYSPPPTKLLYPPFRQQVRDDILTPTSSADKSQHPETIGRFEISDLLVGHPELGKFISPGVEAA